jgi:hypothetical protein
LFGEIAGEIVKALESLEMIPKGNLSAKTPGPTPAGLPAVYVYNPRFVFEDGGFGGGAAQVATEIKESLSGDGSTTSFVLSGRPQRPLLRLEHPTGVPNMENVEFTVDYSKASISFSSPPAKGEGNIVVRYNSAKGAGTLRYVRLNLSYNVDIWSATERERDEATIEAIKAVALSQENLSQKGMQLRPVEGRDLGREDGIPTGVFAKRVVYSVEVNLPVKVPAPTIEKIELKQVPESQLGNRRGG